MKCNFFPLLEILYVVLIENKKEIIDSLVSEWKATAKAPHYILNKIKMNLLILLVISRKKKKKKIVGVSKLKACSVLKANKQTRTI